MESLKDLFRIGRGPSSSHTLAPARAAQLYHTRFPSGPYRVTLYGSLAATGEGHLTLGALRSELGEAEIVLKPEITLPYHPNGMEFESLSAGSESLWRVYSVGGGALSEGPEDRPQQVYSLNSMTDILGWCHKEGQQLWMYVIKSEENDILEYLKAVWEQMKSTVERGICTEGVLPGGLCLPRKGANLYARSRHLADHMKQTALVSAYALAVSEENAAGETVVTAPTCGASGVLPALLYYLWKKEDFSEDIILHALATAGLVGNLIKHNGSISGAEVGCQGEVGAACSMAAAACAQLLGGSSTQIEYAAEMGLEHHLGLTCDPVAGLVQIPCIERNAMAATRALDCAEYALLSDGGHVISFDQVVETMTETGHDIPSLYRETAQGGLAKSSLKRHFPSPDKQVQ